MPYHARYTRSLNATSVATISVQQARMPLKTAVIAAPNAKRRIAQGRTNPMSDTWPERIRDYVLEKVVFLPLEMATRSKSRIRRLLWVALLFLWSFPAITLAMPIIILCMIADIFLDAWKGNL
jgi:hypothetical protein